MSKEDNKVICGQTCDCLSGDDCQFGNIDTESPLWDKMGKDMDANLPTMNEQEKTVEEVGEAANRFYNDNYQNPESEYQFGQQNGFLGGFLLGAHWKQSDPAFIESIVRQTLEYAEKNTVNFETITWLKDKIVNNIIKKK